MSWSGLGKLLVGFAGVWLVGLLMMLISLALLKDMSDSMVDEAWKNYPVHDWQSGCTLDELRERCHPSDCEWGCPPCECD